MAYNEVASRANIAILLDITGGDLMKTLEIARKYDGQTVHFAATTLERAAIIELLNLGWDVDSIVSTLKVNKLRVTRIKRRLERGKKQN